MNIMIVEDERIIAEDIRMTVEALGFRVAGIVGAGKDAIAFAGEQSVDLVMMDIHLQGEMDGIDAAKTIFERYNIPVVFLTAYADPQTVERIRQTTAYGFAVKPVSHESIRGTLELAIDRHQMDVRLKEREEKLRHVNQVLRAIRNVNQLIVKETRVSDLLQGVCNNLAEGLGYQAALIAVLNHDTHEYICKYAGYNSTLLSEPLFSKHDLPDCAKQILPLKQLHLIENAMEECGGCPFKTMSPDHSRYVVQFKLKSGASGLMAVVIPLNYAADPDEQDLFRELVDDVVHALDKLALEEAHRQAEQQKEESRLMLQTVLDTIPVKVFWKDRHSNYLGCNVQFAKDAGLDRPEAIVGKNDKDLMWADQADLYQSSDREVIQTGKAKLQYEETQKTHKGGVRFFRKNKVPLKNINGNIEGVLVTSEDITLQKETEMYMVRQREFIKMALDAQMDTFVIFEPKSWKVLRWNKTVETVTGYSPEELSGLTTKSFCLEKDVERILNFLKKLKRGESDAIELPLVTKSRQVIEYEYRITHVLDPHSDTQFYVSVGRDITERNKADLAVRASENMLRNIVEHSSELFFMFDKTGQFTFISPQCKPLLGYSAEELSEKWCHLFTDNPINENARNLARHSMETGQKLSPFVLELRHQSGAPIYVEVDESPLKNSEGQVTGVVGAVRNITQRKKIEEALVGSEAHLREWMMVLPVGLVILDINQTFEFRNQYFINLFESKQRHLKNMDAWWVAACPDEDYRLGLQEAWHTATLIAKGSLLETPPITIQTQNSQGIIRYIEMCGKLFNDKTILIFHDITGRKKTEMAFKVSEVKYRTLLNSQHDAVFLHPLMEKGFAPFIEVNDIACQRYGYSRDEWLNLTAFDITAPLDVTEHAKPTHRKSLLEQKHMVFETIHITKSGHPFPVEISSTIMDLQGEKYILAVVRDITERQQIHEALKEAEQRMRNVLETILLLAVSIDVHGNTIFVNDYFLRLTGWTRREVLGYNWYDKFMPKETAEQSHHHNFITMIQNEEIPAYHENVIQLKNGEKRVVAWNNTLIRTLHGEIVGATCIGEDITIRKQAEKQLRPAKQNIAGYSIRFVMRFLLPIRSEPLSTTTELSPICLAMREKKFSVKKCVFVARPNRIIASC